MQKNGSQLPASHFVLKKRVPISAWEQQELFLQEQQVRQQEQQQVQESAWKSADPLPEQQEQQQELLL